MGAPKSIWKQKGKALVFQPKTPGPGQLHRRRQTFTRTGFLNLHFDNPHPTDTRVIAAGSLLGTGEIVNMPRFEMIGHTPPNFEVASCDLQKPKPSKPNPLHERVTQIWTDLGLDTNPMVKTKQIRTKLWDVLTQFHDVFTSPTKRVGETAWETFRIDLVPGAKPFHDKCRPSTFKT